MRKTALLEKEWVLQKPMEIFVTEEVNLSRSQASRLCDLFKEGCESAYIARYRGDVHGGLPPDQIRKAMDAYDNALELNKKVSNALTTITAKVEKPEEKQIVTERLKQCEDVQEVSEISKEFSTGVKKTKANIAKELGLEEHAIRILEEFFVDMKRLISEDMKTESIVADYLKICLADMMNKDTAVKNLAAEIAKQVDRSDMVVTAKLNKTAEKKKEEPKIQELLNKYKDYIGKTWRVANIRDHQVSALNRAAEEGIISWSVDLPVESAKRYHPYHQQKVHSKMQNFYNKAFDYSITAYFVPKIERAVKKFLTTRSTHRAILIFGQNVEQLFQQEGVRSRYVIALDPGSLVKAAFLKPNGSVIAMDQFGIRGPHFDKKGEELLKTWATQTKGADLVFAIGNGSNTYDTQSAVANMIDGNMFPAAIDCGFCVVPEHGASKYSCTPAAAEEFGEKVDIKQISAVSIGRRLIDPMSEYVKIEPQHLGKGQYQLSIDEKLLKTKLTQVVRDRVSLNGADLNNASKHLLKQICGLGEATASAIVKYREENERFRSREELKKVKGIGEVVFRQCSGFLTISDPGSSSSETSEPPKKKLKKSAPTCQWQPLDATIVHPEDYEKTEQLLTKLGLTVSEATDGRKIPTHNLSEDEARIAKLLTTKHVLKPPPPIMKQVRAYRDLQVGQQYTGVVRNKTDFGVFVDIGIEQDGLAHISHFRQGYDRPHGTDDRRDGTDSTDCLPAVGDILEFTIAELKNGRIGLKPLRTSYCY